MNIESLASVSVAGAKRPFAHARSHKVRSGWRTGGLLAAGALLLASGAPAATPAPAGPVVPAFPGAEGAGAVTRGGRGGRVLEVTNLQDSGPGSFRAAVEAGGPRIVVFRVSGIVKLESLLVIKHPFLTIAGQTAPGDGICIAGNTTTIDAEDVIVRYVRFRRGNLAVNEDALNARSSPGRIILDHCSFSWGLDENVSLYRYMKMQPDGKEAKLPIENITIQWCISSEALNPRRHAFGSTLGGRNVTFHHNLFANNTARNPSIGWGDHVDFRNNVIFNWQHRTIDGGDATSHLNIVGNYFKSGPATQRGPVQHRIAKPEVLRNFNEGPVPGRWHIAGNYVHGHPAITADNWAGGVQFDAPTPDQEQSLIAKGRIAAPVPAVPIVEQSAEAAYELVLANVGANRPKRDPVDDRIVHEVRTGKPTYGNGIVNSPADVGGYPEYRSLLAPPDADHDGMPDAWERRHGFNPEDPADGPRDADRDGYTNLEEFLNGTEPKQFVDYTKPANNVNML